MCNQPIECTPLPTQAKGGLGGGVEKKYGFGG